MSEPLSMTAANPVEGRGASPDRSRSTALGFWSIVPLLSVAALAVRLATMSGAPDNDDAFLFIRGVERFAVAEARPHWHGYPVYIAFAKGATFLTGHPILGLQVVSAVASAAVAVPLGWIALAWAQSLGVSRRRAMRAGCAAALLWLVAPASWVTGTQIISDTLGLLFGVGFLALCVRGVREESARSWMAASVLAGIMIGVRLVNVTMLAPFVWKGWSARRERWGSAPPAVALTAGVLAGAIPWVAALAWDDGPGFIAAGRAHLSGHFTRYGESLFTDAHPLRRPSTAFYTLAVHGLGTGTPELGWMRVLAGVGWLATVAGAVALRPWRGRMAQLLALWIVPHLLYVFVAHDVAYPRYALSAAALVTMWGGLAAASPKPFGAIGVLLAIVATLPISARLAAEQARQPPVEYQAARYLARHGPDSIVMSPEFDLIAIYLPDFGGGAKSAIVRPDRVPRWRLRWTRQGYRVYATSIPAQDSARWVPVARFCRDPMIEPLIRHDLWLYSSEPADAGGGVIECGTAR
ncbi:MAG TPA: hypothetical protein VMR21_16955 [Vicinamibacteria bacterium]|nr:hypothetical protein [Vicinamibacteria bacterium]